MGEMVVGAAIFLVGMIIGMLMLVLIVASLRSRENLDG